MTTETNWQEIQAVLQVLTLSRDMNSLSNVKFIASRWLDDYEKTCKDAADKIKKEDAEKVAKEAADKAKAEAAEKAKLEANAKTETKEPAHAARHS